MSEADIFTVFDELISFSFTFQPLIVNFYAWECGQKIQYLAQIQFDNETNIMKECFQRVFPPDIKLGKRSA